MSKAENVKAAAQGGTSGGGGGGGLPGTWSLEASGARAMSPGQTVTLATVPSPSQGEVLLIVASGDGSPVHVAPGSTIVAPGNATVVYDRVGSGLNTDIKARSGNLVPPGTITWAVFRGTLS